MAVRNDTKGPLELCVQIYDLLYSLGADASYTGFFHTSRAVYLAVQRPERLLLITKWLYPEVARHYRTSVCAVERNIRTLARIVWDRCPDKLSQIARCDLERVPSNARFISILAAHLKAPTEDAAECTLPKSSSF